MCILCGDIGKPFVGCEYRSVIYVLGNVEALSVGFVFRYMFCHGQKGFCQIGFLASFGANDSCNRDHTLNRCQMFQLPNRHRFDAGPNRPVGGYAGSIATGSALALVPAQLTEASKAAAAA